MSYYQQLYPPVRRCRSEMEIRNLFERHMKVLLDQKRKMINEIMEWEANLIRRIQENVVNQKTLLEQHCKYQLNYLQTTCQEFLDTALIYEEKKNREEVRQLIDQCHSLKIELAVFEYPEQPIPFITVEKEKQLAETRKNMSATSKFHKQSTIDNDFRICNNKSLNRSPSSIPNSANATVNQMNRPLLTNSSRTDTNHLIIDDVQRTTDMIDFGDNLDKCPACFIIFPSTMDTRERTQHVNEHFEDN